jgi:hypothetical protein
LVVTGAYRVPAAARARAEYLMTDTCTVTRPVAPSSMELDPVTLLPVESPPDAVWSGPCRVRLRRVASKGGSGSVAGDNPALVDSTLSVPYSVPTLQVNDIVVVTGSVESPAFVGTRYRVTGILPNTQATAQRVQIEAVVG